MAVRTMRPEGISQENRTNPFFVILRKLAEEQMTLSSKITTELISRSIILCICPFFLAIHAYQYISVILLSLALSALFALYAYLQITRMKTILEESVVETVSQMIFSNDYQFASLNNEELVNMAVRTNWINGHLSELIAQVRLVFYGAIVLNIILFLWIFLI